MSVESTPVERTPPQTTGPYFPVGMLWDPALHVVATPDEDGPRLRLEGRVLDGEGSPLRDVLVELWQADGEGRYRHPSDHWDGALEGFTGFGRSGIDADGWFRFETIKPGPVRAPGGLEQAPHLVLQVFGRGLLDHLTTRVYFPDEPANEVDAVLGLVPADRRATLVARADPGDPGILRFDVVLQGPDETVFFNT